MENKKDKRAFFTQKILKYSTFCLYSGLIFLVKKHCADYGKFSDSFLNYLHTYVFIDGYFLYDTKYRN